MSKKKRLEVVEVDSDLMHVSCDVHKFKCVINEVDSYNMTINELVDIFMNKELKVFVEKPDLNVFNDSLKKANELLDKKVIKNE